MRVIETYFIWFVLYSVIGWIYESIFCSIRQHRFINRGFLNGPYCPIYGCGAVLDIIILGGIKNPFLLFLAAALLTSVLEYLTSWVMELLFHARWWDYSDKKFNINGRVYLTGMIAFGAFSVVLLKLLHPFVSSLTDKLSDRAVLIVFGALLVIMLTDTIFTLTKFSQFNKLLSNASGHLDEAAQSVKELYGRASSTYHTTIQKINSQVRRMLLSFPGMKSVKYGDNLKRLREFIISERNKKKKD